MLLRRVNRLWPCLGALRCSTGRLRVAVSGAEAAFVAPADPVA
jgi:hypothetical protein